MAVSGKNRHYHWYGIGKDHWFTTGKLVGISHVKVDGLITQIIDAILSALDSVRSIIPTDFPLSVADPILDGLARVVDSLDSS